MSAFWRTGSDGPVFRFRLDSDDGRQTLSPDLLEELAAGAARETERGSAVIVVESGRDGLFAAGADLKRLRELDGPSAHEYARRGQEAIRRLRRIPAAVVVEIDGPCFGGALDLAMGCDLRLASARASFSHPGPRLGFITGWGGTVSAPSLLGNAGARALLREGEVFDAESARRLGLVDEVIPRESWSASLRQIEARLPEMRFLWRAKPWS